MSDDSELRLKAGRSLAREIGNLRTLDLWAANGYTSGMRVVVALEDDDVSDVFARARSYPGAVLIAVYCAPRDSFRYVMTRPGDPGQVGDVHDGAIGWDSTIRMFTDYLESRLGHTLTFTFAEGHGAEVKSAAAFRLVT